MCLQTEQPVAAGRFTLSRRTDVTLALAVIVGCLLVKMLLSNNVSADCRHLTSHYAGKCLIWYIFSSARPYWLIFWALKTSWIVSICVLPAVPAADLNSLDVVRYKVSVFTAAFLTLCSKVSIFTVAPSMRAFHELVFYSQFKHDV